MEEMDGNGMTESAVRRGALTLAAACESAREDEQVSSAWSSPDLRDCACGIMTVYFKW